MKKLVSAVLLCLVSSSVFAVESLTATEIAWIKSRDDIAALNCDTYSKESKKNLKGVKISIPGAYYSKNKLLPNSKLNCLVMDDYLQEDVSQLVVNEVAEVDGYEVEIPHNLGAATIKGKGESGQWVATCLKDAVDDSLTCNIHQKNLFIFKQGDGYAVIVSGSGDTRGYSFVRVDKNTALKSNSEGRFDEAQSQKIITSFTEGQKALVRNPATDGGNQDESIGLDNFSSALKVMNLMAESRI